MTDLCRRDGQLIENWYIACQAKDLKPKKITTVVIYDLPLILFRDQEGAVSCLIDRCIHRHSPLSAGKLQDGVISCPYHGWKFNSLGELIAIPSEKDHCFKAGRRRLRRFPVQEQDGFIWVFMGKNPGSSMPWHFPYEKSWTHYVMETSFSNEVTHLAENFMDVPHTTFVHRGWFRNASEKKMQITVETRDKGVLVTYEKQDDKIGFINKFLNPKNKALVHTDHFIMPNITKVDYLFGETGFSIISQCTPISKLKTKVYTAIIYKLFPSIDPFLKPFLNWYTRVVIEQDLKIMQIQGRNISDLAHPNFMAGKADIIHHEIEKLRSIGITKPEELANISGNKKEMLWI